MILLAALVVALSATSIFLTHTLFVFTKNVQFEAVLAEKKEYSQSSCYRDAYERDESKKAHECKPKKKKKKKRTQSAQVCRATTFRPPSH
jgi:hypothetical protein